MTSPTDIRALLARMMERGASDLHLKAGRPPVLRVGGMLETLDGPALAPGEVDALVGPLMDERCRRRLADAGAADFSYVLDERERFRLNVYRQRGHTSAAVRHVPRFAGTFQHLHLPAKVLEALCHTPQGLVLFAGPTGCGTTTTMAACVEAINQARPCHIVTIEDPIEYVFADRLALVNQREVGTDSPSFAEALRAVVREDPDVVVVGDMRDRETCESVLRLAGGAARLVLSAVHTPRAAGAVARVLNLFPEPERPQVRQMLAANLRAVVCQMLVPCADVNVSRVPATEVLLVSPAVRKMILDGEEDHVGGVITSGADFGMYDFTQDLARLVREEWVAPKDAYDIAPNPEALKMAIRGIAVK